MCAHARACVCVCVCVYAVCVYMLCVWFEFFVCFLFCFIFSVVGQEIPILEKEENL